MSLFDIISLRERHDVNKTLYIPLAPRVNGHSLHTRHQKSCKALLTYWASGLPGWRALERSQTLLVYEVV